MKLLTFAVVLFAGCSALEPEDRVLSLPDYGPPKTRHFAGLADVTSDDNNKIFYYFVESDIGSNDADTPLLLWFNGGPGASSSIGLFTENLGPQKITSSAKLVDNEDRITKKYHLMAIDNPVGAGYSNTKTGAYVKSEEEMRTQVVQALRVFFQRHPEYSKNPLWVSGESYGGKYVPNIAYEIAVNATEIPLKGIIVGNGLYDSKIQYPTVGSVAFGEGIIDEHVLQELQEREKKCIAMIETGWTKAGDFCENATVRWLYTDPKAVAGQMFYYDFGMVEANEMDILTHSLSSYLNRADVKAALHVGDANWTCADETGPVADALSADFTRPSTPVVNALLETGKQVVMYNGVRDGSVCNHIGNLKVLLSLNWTGAEEFKASGSTPWPSSSHVMGHIRGARNLRFATVLRTGHLVPTVVPESFATLLAMILEKPGWEAVQREVVV